MSLYNRYMKGETDTVYSDIQVMGKEAFSKKNYSDVEAVLTETFQRVASNLEIIYRELVAKNYVFRTQYEYNSQKPLHKPLSDTDSHLNSLDTSLLQFGHIPLSLKTFYRIVGGCNFAWDYETNENYIWNFADPIQVVSLDDLVSEMTDKDYLIDLKEDYEGEGFIGIPISADFYHKDNTSGGLPYSVKMTKDPSVDSQLLYEEHETTFINYLRICFDNCGFSRMRNSKSKNNYQLFFDKVKPQLKAI